MLFKKEFLDQLEAGKVKFAFRKWDKLRIKEGGTVTTPIGVLKFTRIEKVTESSLTQKNARQAGHDSLDELKGLLKTWGKGSLYKIYLERVGPDPRIKLRENTALSGDEIGLLLKRLQKTELYQILSLIQKFPETSAKILAQKMKMDTPNFKQRVRRLKSLGLTLSLKKGYKLSERGLKFLDKN